VASALMLSVAAFPALAIHKPHIPADECATNAATIPCNNPETRAAIETKGPGPVAQGAQSFPIGNVTKVPTECPAPQK
jgi:hypothetical protein